MIIQAEWRAPRKAIQEEGDEYIGYVKNALSKKMAEGMLDILSREPSIAVIKQDLKSSADYWRDEACYRASLEWKPLVKCKECKHRPEQPIPCVFQEYPNMTRFDLQFPDGVCPSCEYPPDDFFCAYGEREDKNNAEIHEGGK